MPSGIYKRKPIIKKGDKFNKLTAIKFSHRDNKSRQYWLFRCDCGNEKVICVYNVKGNTKSCGCFNKKAVRERRLKHGMYKTKIYRVWRSMKERCLNTNHKHYKNYGGRGIIICSEWLGEKGFENFYEDMGERPIGKSLDRIKNNLGYSKSNCKWSSPKQQSNNTRTNHFLLFKGKTKNITQWAEELGIERYIIYSRLKRGWSIERTLTFNIER